MKKITIAGGAVKTVICTDRQPRGVMRVATTLAYDIREITGQERPDRTRLAGTGDPYTGASANADVIIAAGVLGQGGWIDTAAAEGLFDCSQIVGKRECYRMTTATLANGKQAVLIAGSDLLGAEYGLYKLSELCGVSAWHYWADVTPKKRKAIELDIEQLDITSKEPAVKLRGFFLNDEWPSLGHWATETFGGFNELFYQKVFDLLLRLRGNFLWPAMWTGVFSEDGLAYPTASAELADEYGIVMGTSHHEPLYRAGEEFSYMMTDSNDKGYGADWNYHTNTRGIYDFWEDSVKRNKDLRSLITVGMRGERDSKLLGENATLADNIGMIKKTIIDQKKILADNGLADAPKVLALYKEVEDYFHGDETTEGLKSWDGLDDVMLLLSDDNYGNTRTLPTPEDRDRPAGWGLYYHFDYHGAPISHEWVNSTPITKAWEQLTTAYQFGIRGLWVANVGDLRPDELPLSYFLDLAFDYDELSRLNKTSEWLLRWTEKQFGEFVDNDTVKRIAALLDNYTRMNGDRRPEAIHPDTFSFDADGECRRELGRARALWEEAEAVSELIPEERRDAYYGLVEYPVKASANLREMMIYTGIQKLFRKLGSSYANELVDRISDSVATDMNLTEYYNEVMSGGKWRHMMSSKHVNFQNWNDEGSAYPNPRRRCLPENGATMVWLPGSAAALTEGTADLPAFTSTERGTRGFIVTCSGEKAPHCTVMASSDWIKPERHLLSEDGGTFEIIVRVDWEALGSGWGTKHGIVRVSSGAKETDVRVTAIEIPVEDAGRGVFIESDGVICMEAAHFAAKHCEDGAGWFEIDGYGKSLSSMKVLPADTFVHDHEKAPWLEYRFAINHPGTYTVTCFIAPTNDPVKGKGQRFGLCFDGDDPIIVDSLPEGFAAGAPEDADWCRYVLDNGRRCSVKLKLREGRHSLRFLHIDAGIVLQKIEIAKEPSRSFYGYRETYHG